ncbi:histidine phosphatase family protein [Quadrisphaera sp. KR29]|uniref:histidine phosphatase family protein n=1 Tax=Quadrisphaera sp. KR29 TaxID=3461391 RepID=UPI004043D62B
MLPAVPAEPAVSPGDPFPASLWLLRHGESEGNLASEAAWAAGAEALDLDTPDARVPLSARGRDQAGAVGRWLAGLPEAERPTRVLVSPYRRARETLATALAAGGLDLPVTGDERLRERDLGVLDGLTGHGIRARYPEEAERRRRLGKVWYRPPGGESWADVVGRVRAVVATALPRHDGERLLLVTHQAVVMAFRIVLEGLDPEDAVRIDSDDPQPNCALTRYAAGPDGVRLVRYADTAAVEASRAAVTEEPGADVPH